MGIIEEPTSARTIKVRVRLPGKGGFISREFTDDTPCPHVVGWVDAVLRPDYREGSTLTISGRQGAILNSMQGTLKDAGFVTNASFILNVPRLASSDLKSMSTESVLVTLLEPGALDIAREATDDAARRIAELNAINERPAKLVPRSGPPKPERYTKSGTRIPAWFKID